MMRRWKFVLILGHSISDSDDALERALAVLRFWFTKDLVILIILAKFTPI